MIHVFLDTSVLPRNPAKPNQAFGRLVTLAEEGHVGLTVSEISMREWTSQVALACEERVAKASRALRELLRQPGADELLDLKPIETAAGALEGQSAAVRGELVKKQMDALAAQYRMNVAPIDAADAGDMWAQYFAGDPPFGSAKARQDIPDAFIYAAAKRIAGQMGSWKLHCIAADKRLRRAFAGLESTEPYESLEAFFESDAGRTLLEQSEVSQLWTKDSAEVLRFIAANEKSFLEVVKDAVWEHLPGFLEVGGEIPSDNGTAVIASVQDIMDVQLDWTQQEVFAPGWVFVPFAVECQLELEFEVYRANAFGVPKWVHVIIGDFERDHYFEASGSRPGRVTGQLRLQFSAEQLRTRVWGGPATEVDFEEANLFYEATEDFDPEDE